MRHSRTLPLVRAVAAALLAGLVTLPAVAGAQRPSRPARATAPAAKPAPQPATPAAPAAAADTTPRPSPFAQARGVAVDSIHSGPLVNALVRVDGTGREARTNTYGEFLIDSVPPGPHTLSLAHPVLDTIGVAIRTPPITFTAGKQEIVDVGVPSPETIIAILCPEALRARGPGALIGYVREADTESPAEGAKVSLLWYEIDLTNARQIPRLREAPVGSDGRYRICGLPMDMSGKVQVIRGALTTGEVIVELKQSPLALRSMSIAGAEHLERPVATRPDSAARGTASGTVATTAAPTTSAGDTIPRAATPAAAPARRARVTGHVVSVSGQPIPNARVTVEGSGAATLTRQNGDFTLDGVVPGTQTLDVRRLGYSPQEIAVEASSRQVAQVTVTMPDYVPTLETMRVTAKKESGLSDVGYLSRKKMGMGYYLDGDQVNNRGALRFNEVLRTVPGLRVSQDNQGNLIVTSSRDARGGCVNYVVDGSPWQSMDPGDIDQFVRPDEVAAVEVYNGPGTPPQFQRAGQSDCATIVIWTIRRVTRR